MEEVVYPAEAVYEEQIARGGDPHGHPPDHRGAQGGGALARAVEPLPPRPRVRPRPDQRRVRAAGRDHRPLRRTSRPRPCNCSAPDTGNMEVLTQFGTPTSRRTQWLRPLLDGEIRSAFAMTEPDVASSDATQHPAAHRARRRRVRPQRAQVVDVAARCASAAGSSSSWARPTRTARPTSSSRMILVPRDTPGVTIKRNLQVFGYIGPRGPRRGRSSRTSACPPTNLIAGEGDGFMIAQARLGPGRIHHCMRTIGVAERALEMLCKRAIARETFGKPVATRSNVLDWVAEARIELEMVRLLTLKTAWLMDTVGNKHARTEIAAIKVAAPKVALRDHRPRDPGPRRRRRLPGLPAGGDVRARAHAAARRRPGRGAQADDRAARAGADTWTRRRPRPGSPELERDQDDARQRRRHARRPARGRGARRAGRRRARRSRRGTASRAPRPATAAVVGGERVEDGPCHEQQAGHRERQRLPADLDLAQPRAGPHGEHGDQGDARVEERPRAARPRRPCGQRGEEDAEGDRRGRGPERARPRVGVALACATCSSSGTCVLRAASTAPPIARTSPTTCVAFSVVAGRDAEDRPGATAPVAPIGATIDSGPSSAAL